LGGLSSEAAALPPGFHDVFITSADIAGTLVGVPFVAISVVRERVEAGRPRPFTREVAWLSRQTLRVTTAGHRLARRPFRA
jgi:hypothetical protein